MSINTEMTALADAIRAKSGTTGKLSIAGMTTAVNSIVITPGEGDVDLSVVTVTAADILKGKVAVGADGNQITGEIETVEASSDGTKVFVPAGFHAVSAEFDISNGTTVDLSFVTAAASDILAGKVGVDKDGNPVNGTIQTVTASLTDNVVTVPAGYIGTAQTLTVAEMAEPSVSANVVTIAKGYNKSAKTVSIAKASATLSANVVTIPAGYHDAKTLTVEEAGQTTTSGNVVTIPVGYIKSQRKVTVGTAKAAETITPGTANQTVPAGTYLSGDLTIKGDANLLAENIADGVEIFGVPGAHKGGGSGADFYRCKNVYGPYDVKTVIISGCPTAEINGEYIPTEFTTEDWNGTQNPVYKHATANYYYFYEPNNWMTWGVGTDYTSDSLIYRGTAGSSYSWEDSDWNSVEGMTGVYGSTTLDTDVPKTWDGYKAVLRGGVYTFEETLTTGLTYSSTRPQELGVYNANASIKADWLVKDYPTEGLVFFAPLTERLDKAEVGEMTVNTEAVVIENGMAKFLSRDPYDVIVSNRMPFGYTNPEITLFYQFIATHDFSDRSTRYLPRTNGQQYAFIDGSTLKFFNKDECSMTILRNTLYSVMMICKSGKWRVFVNGELKFNDVSYGMFNNDRTWLTEDAFDGYLKNIIVYNRALSDAELETLYDKFRPAERRISVVLGSDWYEFDAIANGEENSASNYPVMFAQSSMIEGGATIMELGVVKFDTSISKWVLYSADDTSSILYRATTEGISGLTGTWEVVNGVYSAPSIIFEGDPLPDWNNV